MGSLRVSEYHHALRICQGERNQGSQYNRMEMSALHHRNAFQSQELIAQRGVVNNLIHHMEQYVGH
eukprot:12353529-Prorocentrum_lima.AAC.1